MVLSSYIPRDFDETVGKYFVTRVGKRATGDVVHVDGRDTTLTRPCFASFLPSEIYRPYVVFSASLSRETYLSQLCSFRSPSSLSPRFFSLSCSRSPFLSFSFSATFFPNSLPEISYHSLNGDGGTDLISEKLKRADSEYTNE